MHYVEVVLPHTVCVLFVVHLVVHYGVNCVGFRTMFWEVVPQHVVLHISANVRLQMSHVIEMYKTAYSRRVTRKLVKSIAVMQLYASSPVVNARFVDCLPMDNGDVC